MTPNLLVKALKDKQRAEQLLKVLGLPNDCSVMDPKHEGGKTVFSCKPKGVALVMYLNNDASANKYYTDKQQKLIINGKLINILLNYHKEFIIYHKMKCHLNHKNCGKYHHWMNF